MTDTRLSDLRAPNLRAEVARTLTPVTPLATPARRARVFLLLGACGLAVVPIAYGLRRDAALLGVSHLWLFSALQLTAATALFRHSLSESIPGRTSSARGVVLALTLAAALVVTITALTFAASPTRVPFLRDARYLHTCSTRTILLGLPALALAGWLLRRGLTMRPTVAGALAGLGAGLLADASWRVYCEVSDPLHVLTAHASGIVTLSLIGALAGFLVQIARAVRPQTS
jgi:hypothetical protein